MTGMSIPNLRLSLLIIGLAHRSDRERRRRRSNCGRSMPAVCTPKLAVYPTPKIDRDEQSSRCHTDFTVP